MCQYFFPWRCAACNCQNNSHQSCTNNGPACQSSDKFYPLPANLTVTCWNCKKIWLPAATTFDPHSPAQRPPVISQVSAFFDSPPESGKQATILAESKPAAYDGKRLDVFLQAHTRRATYQGNGQSNAWENAWSELERSLCEGSKGSVAQERPW